MASDGGIFSFGDAGFYGSAGGLRLNWPITGWPPPLTARATGWWPSDGGIFSFGDAGFSGSGSALELTSPAIAIS